MKTERKTLFTDVKKIPTICGVYLMKDLKNSVVYIGKAKNLKNRVGSYFTKNQSLKNKFLMPLVQKIDYILTPTEEEACLLEAELVKKHKPRYNVRLKDDKSYPYIRLSVKEDYPRFYLDRKAKKKDSIYFGPYTKAYSARRMIQFLNQHFKIRDCSSHFMKNRKKPCLTYDIGRCTAPCVNKTTKSMYQGQVKKAKAFLKQDSRQVLKNMEKEMKELAKALRFEEAGRLRDYIQSIDFCRKQPFSLDKQDVDVLVCLISPKGFLFQTLHIRAGRLTGKRWHYEKGFTEDLHSEAFSSFIMQYYTDNFLPDKIILQPKSLKGDAKQILEKTLRKIHHKKTTVAFAKKSLEAGLVKQALDLAEERLQEQSIKQVSLSQALQEIQKKLHLKKLPLRIECFDISHLFGKNTTAGLAVFEKGEPKTEDYRRYKIQTVKGIDDYAGLKEVLMRRFKCKDDKDPDLLMVDGGKGQLASALSILKDMGREDIPTAAIAKSRTLSEFSKTKVTSGVEKFFIKGRKNPVVFSSHSGAFRVLTHIRNEAHRFAVKYHRLLSEKPYSKR